MPTNYALDLKQINHVDTKIFAFFDEYATTPEGRQRLTLEFIAFKRQEYPFGPDQECWQYQDNPFQFWKICTLFSTDLAPLVEHIFSTPVNSVASEQAFSIQNFLHTDSRSRLAQERVNKMTFININLKTLAKLNSSESESKHGATGKLASNRKGDVPFHLSEAQEAAIGEHLIKNGGFDSDAELEEFLESGHLSDSTEAVLEGNPSKLHDIVEDMSEDEEVDSEEDEFSD